MTTDKVQSSGVRHWQRTNEIQSAEGIFSPPFDMGAGQGARARALIGFPSAGRSVCWPSGKIDLNTYEYLFSLPTGETIRRTAQDGTQHGAGAGLGVGRAESRLFKVSIGKRGGIRRKLVSKRNGAAGRVKGKVARPVGSSLFGGAGPDDTSGLSVIGFDAPLFEDKRDFDLWLASGIHAGDPLANRLQDLGKRAAARAARRLLETRGAVASDTSKADAASDAVLSILQHVRRLDKITSAHWSSRRLFRVLAMYAGRGAFNSLASWSSLGMTGGTDGKRAVKVLSSFTIHCPDNGPDGGVDDDTFPQGEPRQGQSNLIPALTTDLAAGMDTQPTQSEQAARRGLIRWVYQVGFREFKSKLPKGGTGAGNAAAIRAARSRCRVVANVILGASLVDACAMPDKSTLRTINATGGECVEQVELSRASGFSSFKSFSESCSKAGFWESLQAAAAARVTPAIIQASNQMRAWAVDAKQAIQELRAIGAANWDCERFNVSPCVGAALRVRQLLAERAECLAQAGYWRNVLRQHRQANRAAFDRVLVGVKSSRFSNLRSVVGLTVRRKGSGRKLDGALISRARGNVVSVRGAVATVSLPVGNRGKVLPCAKLA